MLKITKLSGSNNFLCTLNIFALTSKEKTSSWTSELCTALLNEKANN